MTALSIGVSATINVGDAGAVVVATNGGIAVVSIVPTVGAAEMVNIGPQPVRQTFGPYSEGAALTLSNISAGQMDYDFVGGTAGAGLLTAAEAASVKALVSGAGNTFIRWCIPGSNTSGTLFKDVSGRGNDATIDASNTTPFAVDSRVSTVVSAAGGVTLPLAAAACDLATDSWLMSFAMTRADPAAVAEVPAAFGASGGSGSPGIYFSHRFTAAGVGRLVAARGTAGQLVSGTDTTVKFSNADGTQERHIVMAYDAPGRSMYLYRNGVLAAANGGILASPGNAWISTALTSGARLGGLLGSGATVAGAFRGWQGYVFPAGALPLNIGRIAAVLAESPSVPLRDYEFEFA